MLKAEKKKATIIKTDNKNLDDSLVKKTKKCRKQITLFICYNNTYINITFII